METNQADRLVAEAREALDSIDEKIQSLRDQKLRISGEVALLLNDRKPLVRIVNAAKGRNGHAADQPE